MGVGIGISVGAGADTGTGISIGYLFPQLQHFLSKSYNLRYLRITKASFITCLASISISMYGGGI